MAKLNVKVVEFEHLRDLNIKQKENEIEEKRSLMQKNEDLRKEIEAKEQINKMRIQRRFKDATSSEVTQLDMALANIKKNVDDTKVQLPVNE